MSYRLPSYGLFSTQLRTSYWFGLPRNVNFAGLEMDVDRLVSQVAAKNNDRQQSIGFVQSSGYRSSAMEHLVPEQMFSTEASPAQGISTVKALAIASAEGQKIWTIDPNNVNVALAAIDLSSEVESEIRNAVLVGKVAITHEQPINFAGGTNIGYLFIDPETGAGAYLIGSGASGGELVLAVLGTLLGVVGVGAAVGAFAFGLIGAAFFFVALGYIITYLSLVVTLATLSLGCDAAALALTVTVSIFLTALLTALSVFTAGIGGLVWALFASSISAFTGAGFIRACRA